MIWYIITGTAIAALIWNRRIGGKIGAARRNAPAAFNVAHSMFYGETPSNGDLPDPRRKLTSYDDAESFAFILERQSLAAKGWANLGATHQDDFIMMLLARELGGIERAYVGLIAGNDTRAKLKRYAQSRNSELARGWSDRMTPENSVTMMGKLLAQLYPKSFKKHQILETGQVNHVIAKLGPGFCDWLQHDAPRKPELWHVLPGLNWSYEEELIPALEWVVAQPDCDLGTAIDILYLMEADAAMRSTADKIKDASSTLTADWRAEPFNRLLAALFTRFATTGFANNRIAPRVLSQEELPGFVHMLKNVHDNLVAEGKVLPFPFPAGLENLRFGTVADTRGYSAHDTELVHVPPISPGLRD